LYLQGIEFPLLHRLSPSLLTQHMTRYTSFLVVTVFALYS